MRIYSAQDEENLRMLLLLKEWVADGFISEEQSAVMRQDLPCSLRRTNLFLRIVFFLFTMLSAGAAVGLFFIIVGFNGNSPATGFFLLVFGGLCYWGAEAVVGGRGFYRFGIEEALAVLTIAFLCAGIGFLFFSGLRTTPAESVIPITGVAASLLIYRRFGFQYMFFAALVLAATIPGYWTSSGDLQHLIVAGSFTVGLAILISTGSERRFDFRDGEYALSEAMLWLGLYLAINLQLSSIDQLSHWWSPVSGFRNPFPLPFYWTTYGLIWLIPVAMFRRAFSRKDRAVLRVAMISALLTFVTNKPYLGMTRHSWDPMILGVLLTGVAIAVRHWLASGEGKVRFGFTAERLSAKDERLRALFATVGGALSPTPAFTPAHRQEFGGGSSGGGGASSDF